MRDKQEVGFLRMIFANELVGRTVSPLSLLKNPMILIAGFGMLMVFGMPYLLENSKSSFPFPVSFPPLLS